MSSLRTADAATSNPDPASSEDFGEGDLAKIEKRQGAPSGMSVVGVPSPSGSKCGVCADKSNKRFRNSWREIDVCLKPLCISQGSAWVGNSPFSKRVNAPERVWRTPVEHKFLTRKADAVEKPPGARARAR